MVRYSAIDVLVSLKHSGPIASSASPLAQLSISDTGQSRLHYAQSDCLRKAVRGKTPGEIDDCKDESIHWADAVRQDAVSAAPLCHCLLEARSGSGMSVRDSGSKNVELVEGRRC